VGCGTHTTNNTIQLQFSISVLAHIPQMIIIRHVCETLFDFDSSCVLVTMLSKLDTMSGLFGKEALVWSKTSKKKRMRKIFDNPIEPTHRSHIVLLVIAPKLDRLNMSTPHSALQGVAVCCSVSRCVAVSLGSLNTNMPHIDQSLCSSLPR